MTDPSIRRHGWNLSCRVEAPIATTGVENSRLGLDQIYLRTEDGKIAISGDQIRGLFRHFLTEVIRRESKLIVAGEFSESERLVSLQQFRAWFGLEARQFRDEARASNAGRSLDEYLGANPAALSSSGQDGGAIGRACLTIRDLVLSQVESETTNSRDDPKMRAAHDRTRIRINRDRGSVKSGSLLVREQSFPTGTKLDFESREAANGSREGCPGIVLYGTDADAKCFEAAFALFEKALPALGAMKSAGFGNVLALKPEPTKGEPLPVVLHSDDEMADEVTRLHLRLSDPLLVEPNVSSGNLQQSAAVISGAVIKAAIAEYGAMADPDFQQKYGEVLSSLIVRCAIPIASAGSIRERPRVAPFSLVWTEDANGKGIGFRDAFEDGAEPGLFYRFSANFKSRQKDFVDVYYPSHDARTVSRTRTAIEWGAWHAMAEKLFNYQMIGVSQTLWTVDIVLPAAASPETKRKANDLICFLRSGFIQIGKTRSDLGAEVYSRQSIGSTPKNGPEGRVWRIALQTDANLLTIDDVERLRAGEDLRDVYWDTFLRILADGLERLRVPGPDMDTLIGAIAEDRFDFVAQHAWHGGAKAVRYRQAEGGGYYPYLMTRKGSVFLISEQPEPPDNVVVAMNRIMEDLALRGLPTAEADWQRNPFVRENGYGEVLIDQRDVAIALNLANTR